MLEHTFRYERSLKDIRDYEVGNRRANESLR